MTITEILKHGRENAIRADVLAARLETTPRGLRRQIMQAREQGETILYSPRSRRCRPFTMSKLLDANTASPLLHLLPGSWASQSDN